MCNQIKASLGHRMHRQGEPKFADLLTKVEKKQPVGLIRLGWIMDYPLMENYLGPLYGTNGSSNYYGYSNPTFDSLVKEGSAGGDAPRRPSRSGSRPRTSSPRTCRSSRCGSVRTCSATPRR